MFRRSLACGPNESGKVSGERGGKRPWDERRRVETAGKKLLPAPSNAYSAAPPRPPTVPSPDVVFSVELNQFYLKVLVAPAHVRPRSTSCKYTEGAMDK